MIRPALDYVKLSFGNNKLICLALVERVDGIERSLALSLLLLAPPSLSTGCCQLELGHAQTSPMRPAQLHSMIIVQLYWASEALAAAAAVIATTFPN